MNILRSEFIVIGRSYDTVVKMNTYYCFDGTGAEVQEFWEKMTRVRLKYLPDPGPVGTAIRVAGLMYDGFLIEVDVIAVIDPVGVGD